MPQVTPISTFTKALDGDELKEAIKDAHFIGLRSRTNLTKEMIEAAPKLIAIGCFCIGINQVDLDAAKMRGIQYLMPRSPIHVLWLN